MKRNKGVNKCYKVVMDTLKGYYVSSVVCNKAQVIYRVGEWAEAPEWLKQYGYHLTAFNEYYFAHAFHDRAISVNTEYNNKVFMVFEAEAKGVLTELPPRANIAELDDYNRLAVPYHTHCEDYEKWPRGTIMVKQIKLVKEV